MSLSLNSFPAKWKEATVIPVPKNNSNECKSQRPITLLNSLSKLFEILLYDKIYHFFKPSLTTYQHGFTPGRSTVTNLLNFNYYVSSSLDQSTEVHCIYTDFEKAFDRVSHDGLLTKLWQYGFSKNLIIFFVTFFKQRPMNVKFNNAYSLPYYPVSGVNQGGNLAPLFFSMFINDLPNVLSFCQCLFFADDLKLFASVRTNEDCLKIQNDLKAVAAWSISNQLFFNVAKCQQLIYFKHRIKYNFQYFMNDEPLQNVTQVKDLGVTFDNQLNFTEHIREIVTSSSRSLGFLKRNSKHFNHESVECIYNVLVRSKLEYASIIWSPNQIFLIKHIENVQRKFLMYLHFKKFGHYPNFREHNSVLRTLLEIPALETRRKVSQCLFIFKLVNNIIDDQTILELLSFNVPSMRTRNNNTATFNVPRTLTVRHENSSFISMLTTFNAYNLELSLGLQRFKKNALNVIT